MARSLIEYINRAPEADEDEDPLYLLDESDRVILVAAVMVRVSLLELTALMRTDTVVAAEDDEEAPNPH